MGHALAMMSTEELQAELAAFNAVLDYITYEGLARYHALEYEIERRQASEGVSEWVIYRGPIGFEQTPLGYIHAANETIALDLAAQWYEVPRREIDAYPCYDF